MRGRAEHCFNIRIDIEKLAELINLELFHDRCREVAKLEHAICFEQSVMQTRRAPVDPSLFPGGSRVATLTRHDQKAIVFKRTAGERPFLDLFLMGAGILFAGIGSYLLATWNWMLLAHNPWLLIDPSWVMAFALVLALTLVGFAVSVHAFVPIFKSEMLRVDLHRRTYQCRRSILFWSERLSGSLDEFDHIRVADEPYQDGDGRLCWAVEFVWREDRHEPFRVDQWTRPKSFRLERWDRNDRFTILQALGKISKDMHKPLVLPAKYRQDAGLAISECASWSSGPKQASDLTLEV
jgi:hypothetical protein